MDYLTFFKRIQSGALSGAYILHGEEEFVKESAMKSLTATLDETTRQLNLSVIDPAMPGEQLSAEEVISVCEEMPFFGGRRIVVCRALPMGNAGKKLASYIPNMPPTTLLIFFIRGPIVGKGKELPAFAKAVKAGNGLVEFRRLSPQAAVNWVMRQTGRLGATISQAAAKYLVNLTGTDMTCVSSELAKAAAYVGQGGEITEEALSVCVSRSLEARIFDMEDYFTSGRAGDGIRACRHMLADGESPMGIAAFMTNRFKDMLAARTCIDEGLDGNKVIQLIGGNYPAKKAYEAALKYSREEITASILRFADVGYMQISGQREDSIALEGALIRCIPKRKESH